MNIQLYKEMSFPDGKRVDVRIRDFEIATDQPVPD